MLDGKVFSSAGHALGNRTEIVFRVAKKFLRPTVHTPCVAPVPPDFDRHDSLVRYQTPNGAYVVSYMDYPVGRFEAK